MYLVFKYLHVHLGMQINITNILFRITTIDVVGGIIAKPLITSLEPHREYHKQIATWLVTQ